MTGDNQNMNLNIPPNAVRCVVMAQKAAEIDINDVIGALEPKFGNNPAIICGSGPIKVINNPHPIKVSHILDAGITHKQSRAKAKMLMRDESYGKMFTIAYGSPKIINKALGKALGKVVKKTRSDHLTGIKPDEIGVIYLDLADKVVKVEKQPLAA